MKRVPVTLGIEGKEGGGRCRNKLQLVHPAVEEQRRDAELVHWSEHMALGTSLPHKPVPSSPGTRSARQK